MMILANIEVTTTQMGVFIACLVVFVGLLSKLGELKRGIVNEVLMAIGAQRTNEREGRVPQPFITQPAQSCVERESFHKHADLNRGEHQRIEAKFDGAVQTIQEDVAEIAVQVGQIKVMREANGKALETLNDRVGEMSDNVNELSGAVHQALVSSKQPRRRAPRAARA